ncbi:thiamine pyrophosphokinase [Streptococcus urinalis FB127-CNA-2]|uniref:Thiamine diphosphokinase n=1 Tax=Streptococcus urinalis 2285-97 TaxID=764291 RepID=G5KHK1_9STRE|nr:thiamine diphosphokinase [Streptococcus urinalis]EHJ56427.1 thiamine diphosphokinase [Streptococcus urinalis 2285-97]EKS21104.1 thiamine pyrophosphokinase [Streptococcus urinalis FB127-CNA-2]VEF31113.1 thiamin pyrophosphokinase [Streptococcus urinalis]
MTDIALFVGGDLDFYTGQFDLYVGVDRGSLFLLKNGLSLDYAIGDFDSVSSDEFSNIKEKANFLLVAPKEKNDTDTELAIKTIFKTYPDAKMTIFGAFGGRIDHMLSNLFLPGDLDIFPYLQQIKLSDQQNEVSYFPPGTHKIEHCEGMKYVSFMTEQESTLVIKDAKYNLDDSNYFQKKIYSSNEFIGKPIEVNVGSGYLIVIQSKDR